MESSENIIFANSLIRQIIINKEEYYLCYSHEDLNISEILKSLENKDCIEKKEETSNEKSFGKIEIYPKKPEEKKYYKFFSNNEMEIKETLNINVMNNDNNWVWKIVNILSGVPTLKKNSEYVNEIFKIEKTTNADFILKILIQMRTGITFTVFNCPITKLYFKDEVEYLNEISKIYKEKLKISNMFTKRIDEKIKKNEEAIIKFHSINKKIEDQERNSLEIMSKLLNQKKQILRDLIKRDKMKSEFEEENNENNINNNKNKINNIILKYNDIHTQEENGHVSDTLSLSDL